MVFLRLFTVVHFLEKRSCQKIRVFTEGFTGVSFKFTVVPGGFTVVPGGFTVVLGGFTVVLGGFTVALGGFTVVRSPQIRKTLKKHAKVSGKLSCSLS